MKPPFPFWPTTSLLRPRTNRRCTTQRISPLAILLALQGTLSVGFGAITFWDLFSANPNWNTPSSWSAQQLPGFDDVVYFKPPVANFDQSIYDVNIPSIVDIQTLQFLDLAPKPYHFTVRGDSAGFGGSLSLYGSGIEISGGPFPDFHTEYPLFTTEGGLPLGGGGKIIFYGSANAGENVRYENLAAPFVYGHPGVTTFTNEASAGLAVITNRGGQSGGSGGITEFKDHATAGEAKIENRGGTGLYDNGGATQFSGFAEAGNATINNNPGAFSQPDPSFPGSSQGANGGGTSFVEHASAGNSLIHNQGSKVAGARGGFLEFSGFASAGNAGISSTGGVGPQLTFNDANYFDNHAAASVSFRDSATAALATFQSYGGYSNGWGARIDFYDNSTAGFGTFLNFGTLESLASGPTVTFHQSTTAGHAAFVNWGALPLNRDGAHTYFYDTSSAANGSFTNKGETTQYSPFSQPHNGTTEFFDHATAGNATFINEASLVGSVPVATVFHGHSSAGTATFTNHTGGAFGQGGYLIFADDSTGDAAQVNLLGNGALDISQHHPTGVTIGTLSGDGLIFLGANRLTLGSNNVDTTFTGWISDGGLGGGVGGSITKIGTGSLFLSGVNTYTGGTLVLEGNLITNDAEPFIHGPTQLHAGTVLKPLNGIFNVVDPISSISGGSVFVATDFTKTGPGTLMTDTSFKVMGKSSVNAGKLVVNQTFEVANLHINHGGQLGGNGTILGNVFNAGVVAPGNSTGTLHVNGNYTQSRQGTLAIQIGSTKNYDKLAVSGTVELAGTLALSTGSYRPQRGEQFKILTASKVTGEFNHVSNPFPQQPGSLLYLGVDYTAKAVMVQTEQNSFANALSIFKLTENQRSTAAALDSALMDVRQDAVLEHLDSENITLVPGDLDRIAPEELTSLFALGFGQVTAQNLTLEQRFAELRVGQTGDSAFLPTAEHSGIWFSQSGDFTDQGETPNAPGYESKSSITSLGMDFRASDRLILGFTGGYGATEIALFGDGEIKIEGGHAGLYAMYHHPSGCFIQGSLGGGSSHFQARRSALEGKASGHGNVTEFDALATLGFDLKLQTLTLTPMATARYTRAGLNNFTENSSLQPLNFPNQAQASLLTQVGLRAAYAIKAGAATVAPYTSIQWQHESMPDALSLTSKFANGSGKPFTVRGPAIGQDSVLLSAGINFTWSSYALYLAYQADLGRKHYEQQTVLLGLRMTW